MLSHTVSKCQKVIDKRIEYFYTLYSRCSTVKLHLLQYVVPFHLISHERSHFTMKLHALIIFRFLFVFLLLHL